MKNNILLSKIVPNATENSWSQAYSTLNLFIVISLENKDLSEEIEPIASFGKNILEKLQREFFALEEKKLVIIKNTVKKITESIDENIEYSIVLAAVFKNTLYIITGGKSTVVIKRKNNIGIVALGEAKNVNSFSGLIENDDIIILQTHGFSKKIPHKMLEQLLDNYSPFEITENVAPIIHGSSSGTEAAIVIQYKKGIAEETRENEDEKEEIEETEEDKVIAHKKKPEIPNINISKIKEYFSHSFKNYFVSQKKIFIFAAILTLSIVLIFGIFLEKTKEEKQKALFLSQDVLASAQKKYDEAQALTSLNKDEALKNLQEAKKILDSKKNNFQENSDERKKIENLIKLIAEKEKEIQEGTMVKNHKIVFEVKNSKNFQEIGNISLKGGDLIIADKNTGGILLLEKDTDKIKQEITISSHTISYLTGNAGDVYIASQNGIYSINKDNKREKKIIDLVISDTAEIDTFLGNIYILNKKDKSIDKYASPSYKKASYLQDTILTDTPTSFSIDGSVWVLFENGKISKFTKGKEDDFSVKNLVGSISNDSQIYTDADFKNIYILDKQNQKIFSIDKKGSFQQNYNLKSLENIVSFAVNEPGKKIYVSSSSKSYSFDL